MKFEGVIKHSFKDLQKASQEMTQRYRMGKSHSTEGHREAYLIVRLPATSAVIRRVLKEIKHPVESILDLGAGPGTSIEPCFDRFPTLEKMTLIERDPKFIEMGQSLFFNEKALWIEKDLTQQPAFEPHDLVLVSYAFAEMSEGQIAGVIPRAWEAAKKFLVIIEPGTPAGFGRIKKIRQQLIDCGAHCIAPCPHSNRCPMQENDWCHFSERIERSSLHQSMKLGTMGYEDEKFSYLVVSREPAAVSQMRILRPPQKRSGHISFNVCAAEGLKTKILSRKDKENYVLAKKLDWGDSL